MAVARHYDCISTIREPWGGLKRSGTTTAMAVSVGGSRRVQCPCQPRRTEQDGYSVSRRGRSGEKQALHAASQWQCFATKKRQRKEKVDKRSTVTCCRRPGVDRNALHVRWRNSLAFSPSSPRRLRSRSHPGPSVLDRRRGAARVGRALSHPLPERGAAVFDQR